jgi:FlaA1/EpsC-like NDP-sugar epimerase
MGASKRLCEQYIKGLAEVRGVPFLSVRFGNVLESSGSVVPIFRKLINQRKPLTVTHPEATRYFISKSEAAQLVLQASTYGKGGEIFVLEMGDPVKIVDLARELIFLAGLEPDKDIEIEFTGLRPGEKVVEELFGDGETFSNTPFEKIRMVVDQGVDWAKLSEGLRELDSMLCEPWDRDAVSAKLMELVPTYKPQSWDQPSA